MLDDLQLYFGQEYTINKFITIQQPTMGDIIDKGEESYYKVINALTVTPEKMISVLWDKGIDWLKISDFQLFYSMTRILTVEDTQFLFGDNLDLSKMVQAINTTTNKMIMGYPITRQRKVFVNTNEQIDFSRPIIDEPTYILLSDYLRRLHHIVVNKRIPKNERTKKLMIAADRDDRAVAMREAENHTHSQLFNMISFALNSAGFKYTKNTIRDCGLVEFYDSIGRLNLINQTDALVHGIYGGMVSAKDIPSESLNYMRDITHSE